MMDDYVEFEGQKIKPAKSGVYYCPFGCGNPRYSRPRWRTKIGFLKHLKKCPKSPSAIEAKEKQAMIRDKQMKEQAQMAIDKSGLKIGDIVCYVYEIITKPERDSRGIRVRYEPEKEFVARQEIIERLDYYYGCILINGKHQERICSSMQEAQAVADELRRGWDEHVEFSKLCR